MSRAVVFMAACIVSVQVLSVSSGALTRVPSSCCRETALDFLTSGFPEHEVAFLRDMLGAVGGDANAVTQKLVEMRDEAEAHRFASQLEDMRPPPDQVRLLFHLLSFPPECAVCCSLLM